MRILWFILVVFILSSCIDITDDITIHNDGTGTFKYTINLSQSKVKINSILALDSLNGKKVPSIPEIKQEIDRIKNILANKEGIENVKVENNFNEFIFKFQCDFKSINILENAIKSILESEGLVKNLENINENWFKWDENTFQRIIPDLNLKIQKELTKSEIDELTVGKYISVTRFDRIIDKFDNEKAKLSSSKTAIMLQTNVYALIQNANLLENTIYISPVKQ